MKDGTLKKMEMKRNLMIKSGIENGLQNPKTIRLSRELDILMNQYELELNHNKLNLPMVD